MKILPQVAKIIDFHDGKATCPLCKKPLNISIESGHVLHSFVGEKCQFIAASYGVEDDYHFVIHNIQFINYSTDRKLNFKVSLDFYKNKTYFMQIYGDKFFEIDRAIDVDFNDLSKLTNQFESLMFYS